MGRRRKKKNAGVQGGEELRTIVSVFQLLAAVARLFRALNEGSWWDNWPHLL